jgi:hypothetical protein
MKRIFASDVRRISKIELAQKQHRKRGKIGTLGDSFQLANEKGFWASLNIDERSFLKRAVEKLRTPINSKIPFHWTGTSVWSLIHPLLTR